MENLNSEIEKIDEIYHSQGQLSLMTGEKAVLDFEKEYEKIKKLARQQEIFQNKFDIVITNPPYMGGKGYSEKLKKYVEKNYKDSKGDLFAVFIEKCNELTKKDRYTSMITMQSWMFLSSFENLRKVIIEKTEIQSLNHLGTRAFEEIGGEVVSTVSWTGKNKVPIEKGIYIRLVDYNNAQWKEKEFFNKENYYKTNQKDFEKIPSSPIAYWVSDKVRDIFEKSQKLGDVGEGKQGLATADNNRFLRLWQEINYNKIGFGMSNSKEALESKKKWFPYNKGGEKRKWYGNQEYLINWENNGHEIKSFKNAVVRNPLYYFRESISWTDITSSGNSFRIYPKGFIYDVTGMSYFIENNLSLLGILNNKLIAGITKILNPTLHLQIGDVVKLPYLKVENNRFKDLVQQNINIAKEEWNSRETSWDFEKLFIANGSKISDSYKNYCNHWRDNFVQMHKNEEELNKLFIDIYELNNEMDEKVPFEDITLLKNETKITEILTSPSIIDDTEEREKTSEGYLYNRGMNLEFNKEEIIKQFLSYAVGCIMGRYSIDKNGLIMANSDDVLISSDSLLLIKDREGNIRHEIENPRFLPDDFGIIDKNGLIMANSDDVLISSDSLLLIKDREGNIRHEIENPRFLPDDFGIIPITSENVFANDIVTKVFEFVKALYGEENFEENINFICEALGKKENDSCENILRNYFIKDFYTDHLKRYQKRPIYWLFSTGKKNGFQALVYLHRYQDDTMGRLRAEYLLPYQEKMENLKDHYERIVEDESTVARDRKTYEKSLKELNGMLLAEYLLPYQEKMENLKDHYERIVEDESTVARDRKTYEKSLKELNGMLLEIKNFANDVKHIVEQKISIDLDDGVKVNYEKFGSVLKKI